MLYKMRKRNFGKKGLLLAAALVMVVMVGRVSGQTAPTFAQVSTKKGIQSAEQAAEFVQSLGYTQTADTIIDDIVRIPKHFDLVYEHYNEVQKKCGYDLAKYKGKKVSRYCFLLPQENKTMRATVLVYKGKVIGGDIAVMELGGEIGGLAPLPGAAATPDTASSQP